MYVRPGAEEFVPKNARLVTRYRPKEGPTVPSDGRFSHRQGHEIRSTMRPGTVAGEGERIVILTETDHAGSRIVPHVVAAKGERLKIQRNTVCGLRDAMAKAGSSAKRSRFIHTNERRDERIDNPTPGVGSFSSAFTRHRTGHRRLIDKMPEIMASATDADKTPIRMVAR